MSPRVRALLIAIAVLGAGHYLRRGDTDATRIAAGVRAEGDRAPKRGAAMPIDGSRRAPAEAPPAEASPTLSDAYTRDPERIVAAIERSYDEYRKRLDDFYVNELGLGPEERESLRALNGEYYEGDVILPLEAGVEVVAAKIFGVAREREYLAEVEAVLGRADFERVRRFRQGASAELGARDPELAELFACCVEPVVH